MRGSEPNGSTTNCSPLISLSSTPQVSADHHSRWLAQLRAVEQEIVTTYGNAPEHYADAGFHQFAALRMGIHSLGSKVAWCDETLAAIDRRIAARQPAGAAAGVDSDREGGLPS